MSCATCHGWPNIGKHFEAAGHNSGQCARCHSTDGFRDFTGADGTASNLTNPAYAGSDYTTVAELAGMGVRRISVGGALARAAWGGFLQAAREIAERGTFTALARGAPFAELERAFGSAG